MKTIYLKQLILKNFQKHANLTLDFCDSLNVIYGETDIGKSCIIRALGWLFYNNIKGDSIRKEGTKQTSVKGIFSNRIIVERIKSKTINRYILYIPNEEPKVFDSIGKEIPKEITDLLKITYFKVDDEKINLNIANQISLPFLLDKTGSFRNKLFNALTGADKLDKAMQSLNKDILDLNRQEKSHKEFIENNKDKLQNYQTNITEKKELLVNLSEKIKQISEKVERYNSIKENQDRLIRINTDVDSLKKQKVKIPITKEELNLLETKINKLEKIDALYIKLKTQKKEFNELKEKLEALKIPKFNIEKVNETLEKLNKYRKIIKSLKVIDEFEEKHRCNLQEIKSLLSENKKQYKKLLQEVGICPTCKKEITDKHIKEIKL